MFSVTPNGHVFILHEQHSRTYSKGNRIFKRKPEMKIWDIPGDQFGFRRGKGTTEAIGILRIIQKKTLDIDELCACFIDWQKVYDHVNWTKLNAYPK